MSPAVVRNRLAALACALILAAPLAIAGAGAASAAMQGAALAQSEPTAPGSATPPAAPAPATPPAATAPAAPPASTAPAAAPPASGPSPDAGQSGDDSSSGQTLDMVAHPAAYIEGKSNWSDGFSTLMGAIASIKDELAKSGLTPAGRPIAVFTETDDNGFGYRAMVPIDKAPEGKTTLSDTVKLGQTPAGKAMKFEHRGSYADIDSTYEAITAYLDEKGLEAANMFVEEYLNDVKTPDDPNLQVDIYVLLK